MTCPWSRNFGDAEITAGVRTSRHRARLPHHRVIILKAVIEWISKDPPTLLDATDEPPF